MNILNYIAGIFKNRGGILLAFFCITLFQNFLFSSSVFAISIDDDPCGEESCLQAGIKEEDLPEELQQQDGENIKDKIISVINYLLSFIGIVLLVIVIYCGIILIFSLGDEDKIQDVKKTLINALLGIIIIVLSYSIVYFIGNIMSDPDVKNTDTTIDSGGNNGGGNTDGANGSNGQDGVDGANGADGKDADVHAIEREIDKLEAQLKKLESDNEKKNQAEIDKLEAQLKKLKSDNDGKNQAEIDKIEAQLKKLKSDNDGKNQAEIDKIRKKISDLNDEKNTVEVGKKIEELEDEIALRNQDSSDTSVEEIKKLKEELTQLKDSLSSSVFDTEKALKAIKEKLDTDGSNTSKDVEEAQNILNGLKGSSENEELLKKYEKIQGILNELQGNPNNTIVIEDLNDEIDSVQDISSQFSQIKPSILLQASALIAPVSVTLNAQKTTVEGDVRIILHDDNYNWSVVGPDGIKQVIGNGILRNFDINIPGKYVFTLSVESDNDSVISGLARKVITVKAPQTQSVFTVGQKEIGESLEFTQTQNEEGIIFNPSLSKAELGRSIDSYIWNFNGKQVEEKEGRPVLYTFSRDGEQSVSLTVVDNLGVRTTSPEIKLIVKSLVAYFKLLKDEYENGELVRFSGERSFSSAGEIQEYNWKILKENGELVEEMQSKTFEYSFDLPGVYIIKLVVKDGSGDIASYSKSITVSALPPKAGFIVEKKEGTHPARRTFSAKKSADPLGGNLLYSWDFDGDGVFEKTNQSDFLISHTFEEEGEYTVVLQVKNEFGVVDSYSREVFIDSTLSVEIETESIVYGVEEDISFKGISENASVFRWNFGDRSEEVISANTNTTHSFQNPGKYTVTLDVENESGDKTHAKKTIFIGQVDRPTSIISVFVDGKKQEREENLCGDQKSGIEIFRSQQLELSAENSVNLNNKKGGLLYDWTLSESEKMKEKSFVWKFLNVSPSGQCEKVSLFVTDELSGKQSLLDEVYFFVKNSSPEITNFVVKKPKSQISPVSLGVSLSAHDFDGTIVSYSWWAERKGDASKEKIGFHTTQTPTSILTLPPFEEEGSIHQYAIYGKVIDNDDAVVFTKDNFGEVDTVSVKTDKNRLPTVEIVASKNDALIGDSVEFSAHVVTQDGGDISDFAEYKWDFNNDKIFDKTTHTNSVTTEFETSGEKRVNVKVLYQGLEVFSDIKINVQKILNLPLAKFSATKTGFSASEITLSAESSLYDKSIAGNALQYQWDIDLDNDEDNDGNAENDVNYTTSKCTHIYKRGQTKARVKLTVTNTDNKQDVFIDDIDFDQLSGLVASHGDDDESRAPLVPLDVAENINTTSQDIEELLTENKAVTNEDLDAFSDIVSALSENVSESDYLYSEVVELQEMEKDLKENSNDKNSLLKFQDSLNAVRRKSNSFEDSKWNASEVFGESINKSIKILANTVGTRLDVYGGEEALKKNENIQIFAFIQSADGIPYSGPVSGRVIEGHGIFTEKTVNAVEGTAILEFMPSDIGVLVVEISADETVSGSLTEQLRFIIKE